MDQIAEFVSFLQDFENEVKQRILSLEPPFDVWGRDYWDVGCGLDSTGEEVIIGAWIETSFGKDDSIVWSLDLIRRDNVWWIERDITWPDKTLVIEEFEDRQVATFSELRDEAFSALVDMFDQMDRVKAAIREKYPEF